MYLVGITSSNENYLLHFFTITFHLQVTLISVNGFSLKVSKLGPCGNYCFEPAIEDSRVWCLNPHDLQMRSDCRKCMEFFFQCMLTKAIFAQVNFTTKENSPIVVTKHFKS